MLHSEFYPTLDQSIVEDCFRQAVHKYGAPDAVYFDNGKQFRTRWMARTCSKLGTRLLYAKPYAAASKGKIERFNRTVDSFLAEVSLEKVESLDALNRKFAVWLSECYQNKPHSALSTEEHAVTPETAYRSDAKAPRFIEPETLASAFLHAETRKVDKSGCISFMGQKYQVGLPFLGCMVEVVYDKADVSQVTIEVEGHEPWSAHPLVIGEKTGPRPSLPEHMGTRPTESSRLLEAAEKQHAQRQKKQERAISYTAQWEGGEEDV